ncbi:NUDIX hydrolase [Luteimonas deserti]|uniref:NUDIX hydrolase n=1 Tax=Luteimonas deserti TaxID=2752306 RepID=A0A7Z0QQW9_9GAMM|nr:NUDIX hydrolase [Luteimonas deserti]NYZ63144.1 NUDIX hydrolase [Luteimonas deserti]
MSLPTDTAALERALHRYGAHHPDEAATVAQFLELLEDPFDAFVRERREGHFTASAFVVARDGGRTLLTHHRKLGLWLQPGGHADGDRDLSRVALRETQEETGLRDVRVVPVIFDLDRHRIPGYGDVPAHWHYDVRYVVHAGADERFVVSDESHALAWVAIADVAADPTYDVSLRRMARRWIEGSRQAC